MRRPTITLLAAVVAATAATGCSAGQQPGASLEGYEALTNLWDEHAAGRDLGNARAATGGKPRGL